MVCVYQRCSRKEKASSRRLKSSSHSRFLGLGIGMTSTSHKNGFSFTGFLLQEARGFMVGPGCQILYDHRGERAKQGLGKHISLAPKARRSVYSGAESELMMSRDLTK